jgi:hypothetical protein
MKIDSSKPDIAFILADDRREGCKDSPASPLKVIL